MPDDAPPSFTCPNCRKAFRWKEAIAGKKVRCSACRQKLRVPAEAGAVAEALEPPPEPRPEPAPEEPAETYDLDLPGDSPEGFAAEMAKRAASEGDKCPNCNTEVKGGAVLCLNCGFNFAEGRVMQTAVAEEADAAPASGPAKPAGGRPIGGAYAAAMSRKGVDEGALADQAVASQRWADLHVPLIMIGVAIVLLTISRIVDALMWDLPLGAGGAATQNIAAALIADAVLLVIQFPFFVIGIVLVAKLFGSSYGNLLQALLKLAATALLVAGAGAIMHTLIFILTGGTSVMGMELYIVWGVQLLAFIGAGVKLFDMDIMEVFVLIILVMIAPTFVTFFVIAILYTIFFP